MIFRNTHCRSLFRVIAVAIALVCITSGETLAQRAQQKPKVRTISPKVKPPVQLESKQQGSRGTFTLKVDLGPTFITFATEKVVGGEAIAFSKFGWANLTKSDLPAGATIVQKGSAGQPEIPYLTVALAVPAGATDVTINQVGKKQSTHSSINLLPIPRQLNDTASIREFSMSAYTTRVVHKLESVGPARMRQLTMLHIQVPLLEYDATSRTASVTEKFDIEIKYSAPPSGRTAFRDDVFRGVYDNLVLNREDIPKFAAPFKAAGKMPNAQAFDEAVINWIDPLSQYVKMTVARDGLYRMSVGELTTLSGINVGDWLGEDVRLINRGIEVPVWIEKDGNGRLTAVEFYGEHLRGHGQEYYNFETDGNAYWLTTSNKTGGTPKRYIQKSSGGGNTVTEGVMTLHHERDFDIHNGGRGEVTDMETSHRTQWIPGERWYWRAINPNERVLDTFYIASLPANPSATNVELAYSVSGMSRDDLIMENHRVIVKLNDQVIDEQVFMRYDSLGNKVSASASLLKQGANIVEILSAGTGAQNDRFYVDFYRIEVPTPIAPSIDTAVARGQFDFRIDVGLSGHTVEATVGESYALYNLTDGSRLSGNFSQGKQRFNDQSTTTQPRYVGASLATFLKPKVAGWNKNGNDWSILDKSNGIDYIVLTHPLFLEYANRLKLRRENAGLRAKVVTTEEVFNAFSFGSDEAWSIRRFLDYAYHNYSGTPPSFVTLFGDATWDPKFNRTNLEILGGQTQEMSRHASFVPGYGIPVSDFIFTTVDGDGVDSLFPEMVITRIPVETKENAEIFVTKLIEYESSPAEAWNREFMFVIGGDAPPKSFEHYRFQEEVRAYTEIAPGEPNYHGGLRFPPLNINDTRVLRQFFDGIDVTQVPTLQNEFRRGKSLVHFTGHGATFITDVFFGEPTLYRNQGLYPALITLSCRTGAFAEPYDITLNEAFLRVPGGGVITSFGTTGFGEITYDFYLSSYFFQMFRDNAQFTDSTYDPSKLNIASMWTAAKVRASLISSGNVAENSRLQYSILGDAPMGFVFRPRPEFHIDQPDVQITSKDEEVRTAFEAEEGEFNVRVIVHNFGYSAETPVIVRIADEAASTFEIRDTLPQLHVIDTLYYTIPLDTNRLGQHTLRVTIDPENQFVETNEDNEVAIQFLVNGQSVRPIVPFEASKAMCGINGDSVLIRVLVPEKKFVQGRDRVDIEFDTTSRFTSPVVLPAVTSGFPTISQSYLSSSLPHNYQNVVFWRTRSVINGLISQWAVSSFKTDKLDAPQMHISTHDQLQAAIDVGLRVNEQDRLSIPQSDTVIYTVVAHGSADTTINGHSVGQVFRNNRSIYELMHPKSGFAVVELTADANAVDEVHEFIDIPHDQIELQQRIAKQVDSVIKEIPEGRIVIVLTNFQPHVSPAFTLDKNYIQPALRSLGAGEGFDNLGYFESYALIGRKGAAPGTAIEKRSAWKTAGTTISDTIQTFGTSGLATSPFTASATSYKRVRWSGPSVPSGAQIKFTIIGQRKDNNKIERLSSFNGSATFDQDISNIDANVYMRLAVEADFSRGSSAAESPELASLAIEYTPAPELELVSLTSDLPSVEEGQAVVATYVVRNLLCFPAENVDLWLLKSYQGGVDTVIKRTITVPGNSELVFTDTVGTSGLSSDLLLTATVNPRNVLNEQFTNNNTRTLLIDVVRDSAKPYVEVVFDQRRINDRDYVSPTTEIRMRLFDASPLVISDSLSISALLRYSKDLQNPVFLTIQNPPIDYRLEFVPHPSGELKAELVVNPKELLQPGEYTLTIFARDASGNPADTIDVRFRVSATNGVEQVMNYPNPFTSETDFTFVLRGAAQGADAKISIYTVSGKKIRTIKPMALKTGLNVVHWDGRDEDGNEIANGTYLYRVTLNASNSDGSAVEEGLTERAVKSK